MKKQNFAGLFVGLCLCATPLIGQAQTKIMAFGDSVTSRGSSPESSYRYWLWKDLTDAGFSDGTDFTFIGSQNGVSDGAPANDWPDQSYEGGDGWTSADALNDAPGAAGQGPDVVLLDFGSNDISPAGIPLDQTINNLDQTIQAFAAQNSSVIILLARPTPFAPDPSSSPQDQRLQRHEQSQLAGMISRLAKTERKAGINVIAVNQFGGFSVRGDTTDGSHPNVRGEQKIAKRYFSVLRRIVKKS